MRGCHWRCRLTAGLREVLHIDGGSWLAVGRRLYDIAGCCHGALAFAYAVWDEVRQPDSVRRFRLVMIAGLAVSVTLRAQQMPSCAAGASLMACTPHGQPWDIFRELALDGHPIKIK